MSPKHTYNLSEVGEPKVDLLLEMVREMNDYNKSYYVYPIEVLESELVFFSKDRLLALLLNSKIDTNDSFFIWASGFIVTMNSYEVEKMLLEYETVIMRDYINYRKEV